MNKRTIAATIFLTVVGMFFLFSMVMMHPFGVPDKQAMDQYIIDETVTETGANNGVTAVVFDYRGFDTLGEATVLFTAVAGVVLVFRRLKQ